MSVNFLDRLKELAITEFEFGNFQKLASSVRDEEGNETKERNIYLLFTLSEAIPRVTGSISEYNPDGNGRLPRLVTDVTEVRCNLDIIEKYASEFTFDELDNKLTLTGRYKGDLSLDVSAHGDVWLTDVKFSKMSGEWKKKGKFERFRALQEKWKK